MCILLLSNKKRETQREIVGMSEDYVDKALAPFNHFHAFSLGFSCCFHVPDINNSIYNIKFLFSP